MTDRDRRIAVTVITRNRCEELLASLDRLAGSEAGAVTVVDNGSVDGTSDMVRARHPEMDLVTLPRNAGAAGRNIGVARSRAPYVAFADDDSWWEPGALSAAADVLDAAPHAALVTGRILVAGVHDPVSEAQAAAPLGHRSGRALILGFAACGTAVRRDAFLAAGGFHRRFGVGGEEELLAVDLAAAGWSLLYAPEVTAGHRPSPRRDPAARRARVARNALRAAWLRRPLAAAAGETARRWADAVASHDVWSAAGCAALVGDLRWIRRERRPAPPTVEAALRRLRAPARR